MSAFEILQSDGQKLRFDNDDFSWEYHTEEHAGTSSIWVWKEVNGDSLLVTTVYNPIRVDEVHAGETLMPPYHPVKERIDHG